jgi:hypothetical protein
MIHLPAHLICQIDYAKYIAEYDCHEKFKSRTIPFMNRIACRSLTGDPVLIRAAKKREKRKLLHDRLGIADLMNGSAEERDMLLTQ